jgi:hypothetical protein
MCGQSTGLPIRCTDFDSCLFSFLVLQYCEKHFEELFAPKCSQCGLGISGQVFEALEQKYHLDCFSCAADGKPIGEGVMFHVHENKIYCPSHFESLFLQKCQGCKEGEWRARGVHPSRCCALDSHISLSCCPLRNPFPSTVIRGQFLKVMDQHYHSECWKCTTCSTQLKSDNCAIDNGRFFCKPCLVKQRASGPVLQQMGSNPQAAPNMNVPGSTAAPSAGSASASVASVAPPAAGGISAAEAADKATAALAAIRARQAAEAESAASAAAAQAPTASLYADPSSKTYPYALLKDKNARPADVDPSKKELYLTADEFTSLFKLTKEEFGKLPEWRKKALKTPLMLF